ncbi:MAG: metal-sensitive transcriptional regulator [Patescibacteria group bacterium]|nr:metal-sensitive transcriptional regulator [Patescibacteria group bacterium]
MKQQPIISRLHRTSGQIQGIEKMVKNKRDCQEILQQLLAARSSIEKICLTILQDETSSCFTGKKSNCHKKLNNLEKITSHLFKIK